MVAQKPKGFGTPTGNTGLSRQESKNASGSKPELSQKAQVGDRIEAHLDYLILCGTVSSMSELDSACWAAFGVRFLWSESRPGTHGRFYESNVVTSTGLLLSSTPSKIPGQTDYRISIPGGVLQSTTEAKIRDFGRLFMSMGARCTRFDWAIDDFARQLDIDTVLAHCESGRTSGFVNYRYYRTGASGQKAVGTTLYLGSSQSDQMARIYDKNVESGGKINSIRFEIQVRDNIANSYFCDYFADGDVTEIFRKMCRRAIGKYRFVHNTSEVLSRCPDVDWWAEFVRRIGGQIKIRQRREQPQISDKKRWIERQVAGTLALLLKCLGVDNAIKWLVESIKYQADIKSEKHENYYSNWRNSKGRDAISFVRGLDEMAAEIAFRDWHKQAFGVV
jgi:DNA relaxase NicK